MLSIAAVADDRTCLGTTVVRHDFACIIYTIGLKMKQQHDAERETELSGQLVVHPPLLSTYPDLILAE